ncbi:hypothetical protein PQS90_04025 [Pseudomonas sp. BLCC-B13]|uniref:hypothetical protein n=1 Tax=Pseudomonas sp. BLCC-B13 TaxID=3025314 RepID=UPI00234F9D07|nr:hypothetical protein [Pseudomonas sp. BLCC-B13]MDC7824311.1 hypothetical protein [Pseudomonas sp. BLCC-B13]
MDLSTLKVMRKVVPGTVFIFFGVPLYKTLTGNLIGYDDALKFSLDGYGAVIAFIIGAIFCSYDFRKYFISSSHERINRNIFTRLYTIGRGRTPQASIVKDRVHNKNMMRVFYSLVDGDESLKEKGKLVRDNGLIWSSCADLVLLGTVYVYVYLISVIVAVIWFPAQVIALVVSGLLIGLLSLIVSVVIFPRVHAEHLKLSNEQINIIDKLHREKLTELLNKYGI